MAGDVLTCVESPRHESNSQLPSCEDGVFLRAIARKKTQQSLLCRYSARLSYGPGRNGYRSYVIAGPRFELGSTGYEPAGIGQATQSRVSVAARIRTSVGPTPVVLNHAPLTTWVRRHAKAKTGNRLPAHYWHAATRIRTSVGSTPTALNRLPLATWVWRHSTADSLRTCENLRSGS